jgi:uncharacterized protein YjiS (DUF1127 family)
MQSSEGKPYMTIADIVAHLHATGQPKMARIVDITAKDADQQRRNCWELARLRDELMARLEPRSGDRTYRAPAESDG